MFSFAIIIIAVKHNTVKRKIKRKGGVKMTDTQIAEVARAERLEYFRKWRAANKDKVKEANRKYWEKRVTKRLQEENAKK